MTHSSVFITHHAVNSHQQTLHTQSDSWECDVHRLRTGELVIRHDRLIGTSGKEAADMNAREYAKAHGEPMFTLQEWLAAHRRQTTNGTIYIEMKGAGGDIEAFTTDILRAVKQHDLCRKRVHIFSFQHSNIRQLLRINADTYAQLGLLFRSPEGFHKGICFGEPIADHGVVSCLSDIIEIIERMDTGIDFIAVQDNLIRDIPETCINMLHERGLHIGIWQTNTPPVDTAARNRDMHTAITAWKHAGYHGSITAITDSPHSLSRVLNV